MLDDLSAEDYEDLVSTVMDKLQCGLHLERCASRKSFVLSICSEKVKPFLVQYIMEMVARYLEMYNLKHA